MKAIVLHGARDVRAADRAEPGAPGAGEVLVRMHAVGLCGTDRHWYLDGHIGATALHEPFQAQDERIVGKAAAGKRKVGCGRPVGGAEALHTVGAQLGRRRTSRVEQLLELGPGRAPVIDEVV